MRPQTSGRSMGLFGETSRRVGRGRRGPRRARGVDWTTSVQNRELGRSHAEVHDPKTRDEAGAMSDSEGPRLRSRLASGDVFWSATYRMRLFLAFLVIATFVVLPIDWRGPGGKLLN